MHKEKTGPQGGSHGHRSKGVVFRQARPQAKTLTVCNGPEATAVLAYAKQAGPTGLQVCFCGLSFKQLDVWTVEFGACRLLSS